MNGSMTSSRSRRGRHRTRLQDEDSEFKDEFMSDENPDVAVKLSDDVYKYNGFYYNRQGLQICGMKNRQGTYCSRLGECPFHSNGRGAQVVSDAERQEIRDAILRCDPGVTRKEMQTYKKTWSEEEHKMFLEGIKRFGRGHWKEISLTIPGRTPAQVQSHAQKYFLKLESKKMNKGARESRERARSSPSRISSGSTSTVMARNDGRSVNNISGKNSATNNNVVKSTNSCINISFNGNNEISFEQKNNIDTYGRLANYPSVLFNRNGTKNIASIKESNNKYDKNNPIDRTIKLLDKAIEKNNINNNSSENNDNVTNINKTNDSEYMDISNFADLGMNSLDKNPLSNLKPVAEGGVNCLVCDNNLLNSLRPNGLISNLSYDNEMRNTIFHEYNEDNNEGTNSYDSFDTKAKELGTSFSNVENSDKITAPAVKMELKPNININIDRCSNNVGIDFADDSEKMVAKGKKERMIVDKFNEGDSTQNEEAKKAEEYSHENKKNPSENMLEVNNGCTRSLTDTLNLNKLRTYMPSRNVFRVISSPRNRHYSLCDKCNGSVTAVVPNVSKIMKFQMRQEAAGLNYSVFIENGVLRLRSNFTDSTS